MNFQSFQRNMRNRLPSVKPGDRTSLLKAIFRLAEHKKYLENLKSSAMDDAKATRNSKVHHRRVRQHVENALASLQAAARASDDPELLVNLDIENARRLLHVAALDLRWIEQQLFPAMIAPRLRTAEEKRTEVRPLGKFAQGPGHGAADIDYWFIAEVEKCLRYNYMAADRPLRPIDYDRIISAVFQAAFFERYEESRVKTARHRMAEQRKAESQPPFQI